MAAGNNLLPISPELQGLVTIIVMALSLTLLYYIMVKTSVKRKEETYKTFTVLKCSVCEHTEKREFKKGDYVGKIIGECPKCGSTMYIHAIFSEKVSMPTKRLSSQQQKREAEPPEQAQAH